MKMDWIKSLSRHSLGCFALALALLVSACSPSTPTQVENTPVATLPAPATEVGTPTERVPVETATLAPVVPTETPNPGFRPELSPPEASVVGVEMHDILSEGEVIAGAGAHWTRRNALLWSLVEPQKGERNWAAMDHLLSELEMASELGLETLLIIRSAPSWAQAVPGMKCGRILPEELETFAAFMRDVVTKLSAPPYNVRYFELGNEPDIAPNLVPEDIMFGCWGISNDPYYGGGAYADMLKVVYPEIKAANPDAQVAVGGLLADCDPVNTPSGKDCTPARYLEGILENGGGDFFDVVSFHAYDYYFGKPGSYGNFNWPSDAETAGPVVIRKARYYKDLLSQYGYTDKGLINTETALICSGSEAECLTPDFERTKSDYLAATNAAAAAEGLLGNIWYSSLGWRGSQLIGSNGQTLPALDAMRVNAEKMEGAAFSRRIGEFENVLGYEFARQGVQMWVLWSLDNQPHTVTLPEVPDQVTDVFGEALATGQELEITVSPVYVEWLP